MADAPDLKSGGREALWVRVPPPLPRESPANRHKILVLKRIPSLVAEGCGSSRAAVAHEVVYPIVSDGIFFGWFTPKGQALDTNAETVSLPLETV